MPHRNLPFTKGQYYHIYNRGANRETIFFTPENYEYCLRLAKKYVPQNKIIVIAYCLMPNHYHFLLRQDSDISLSKFINVLFNAYVQAVNKQRGRKGTLFEGRFFNVHIDRGAYLIHLCRYIHLNPVIAGLVTDIGEWPYSNYLEWIGLRNGELVDQSFIREQQFTPETYIQFVNDHLDEVKSRREIQQYLID